MMEPLSTTAPPRAASSRAARLARWPWGTLSIVALSGLILSMQATHGSHWGENWLLYPYDVRLSSLIAYAFFHADVLHWAVNMALLFAVGPRVERAIGPFGLISFFILGSIVAGLLHVSMVYLFMPGTHEFRQPLLGASGGIMALLGAYAVRFYSRRIAPLRSLPPSWAALRRLWSGRPVPVAPPESERKPATFPAAFPAALSVPVGWALLAWLISEAAFGWHDIAAGRGTVAHWAHVGGFLAGMIMAVMAGMHKAGRREDAITQRSLDLQARRLAEYLRDHPDDAPSRVTYAQVLVHIGETERAARAFCKAMDTFLMHNRQHEAAEAYLAMRADGIEAPNISVEVKAARALEKSGYTEQALAIYDRLSATPGPEAESAGLRAARMLERLNRPEEARQRYQAFLLMFPHSQFAPQAKSRMARLSA